MEIQNNKDYNIKSNLGFNNNFLKLFSKGSHIYNTHISEESTINTISNSLICKKKNNINGEINRNNYEKIFININKAFYSLEQLVINDNDNDNSGENHIEDTLIKNSPSLKEKNEHNIQNKSNNVNIKENMQNKMNIESTKKKKSISIPKLDFSMIFDYYQNNQKNQIKIKEKQMENDEVNCNQKNLKEYIKKHHHHHHHHHYNFQNTKLQL